MAAPTPGLTIHLAIRRISYRKIPPPRKHEHRPQTQHRGYTFPENNVIQVAEFPRKCPQYGWVGEGKIPVFMQDGVKKYGVQK